MSNDELFKAALSMIQVTPENYGKLHADMIMHVYKQVAEAEEQLRTQPSAHAGQSVDQILK